MGKRYKRKREIQTTVLWLSPPSNGDDLLRKPAPTPKERMLSQTKAMVINMTAINVKKDGVVSYYGKMLSRGGKIISASTGEVIKVTGMSFFWSQMSQKFYTAAMVEKMAKDFGCEIVRAAYGIQDDGTPCDPADAELVKTLVRAAIEQDIYVIIDWHSHGAQNSPETAIEFFTAMAKEFGGCDNVIFELFNEPKNVDWPAVKRYCEKVIPHIRKYSSNLIVAGTPNWSQDVDAAAKDPILSDDNLAYALHFYAGSHKRELRKKGDEALGLGAALFVTEWGSVNADGDGGADRESTAEWFDWMDKNELSCCNWAVNDKIEGSSIFAADQSLTPTGEYLRELISRRTAHSPWKNAGRRQL